METRLVVDKKNNLQELRPPQSKYPAAVRLAARIISYIFHPLFIPVYISWIIFKIQSPLFSVNETGKNFYIPRFILLYTFFPLVTVLLLKAVGFISSIHLENRRDRIIPYVICMIYYWWSWHLFDNQPEYTRLSVIISLAIFLASIGGLMANIYMKVSMHAIAAGVMAAFVMLLAFSEDLSFGIYISISVLLAGIICTARFVDSDHTAKEIYVGLLVGILSLVIAMKFS
jgi:membrane-associated HD superfamily phosphohydrolase